MSSRYAGQGGPGLLGIVRITITLSAILAMAAITAGSSPLTAGDGRGFELGVLGGMVQLDEDISGTGTSFEAQYGVRGGYLFANYWSWYADVLFSDFGTDTFRGDTEMMLARSGVELLLDTSPDYPFFVSLGLGHERLTFANATDYWSNFASVGLGQRLWATRRSQLRWELRLDQSLSSDGLQGKDVTQLMGLFGWTWSPGRSTPVAAAVAATGLRDDDQDGDGVIDQRDVCPGTSPGSPVDATGCALDSDGDGVIDAIDRCPETVPGHLVTPFGCLADADGDGVDDRADMCSDTPTGTIVSVSGCPRDSDADGVFDGLDTCPSTPRGMEIDVNGCPRDADGDGVGDATDACSRTPAGATVGQDGCPRLPPLFDPGSDTIVLQAVHFESGSADLTRGARIVLDNVAESLLDWPEFEVEIGGHTDSTGSTALNQRISEDRAEAVLRYLVDRGVPSRRLIAQGYGSSRPIADDETVEGRAENRRIELIRTR